MGADLQHINKIRYTQHGVNLAGESFINNFFVLLIVFVFFIRHYLPS
jgi:hypothetical protein